MKPSSGACSRSMLDENEFLSPYGIRSLSRHHAEHPFVFRRRRPGIPRGVPAGRVRQRHVRRQLQLARARSGCRSTALIIRALLQYYTYYGDDFKVECPTGSGKHDEPLSGRRGDLARPPWPASFCATRTAGGRSTAAPRNSRTIRTGATASCSTSTSTATTAPGSARATRPDGPASSRASCICSRPRRRSRSRKSASSVP